MFYGYLLPIYGRARASARSDHYVFALFFRIPFFMVAREQARAATIMFLRCFFVFLFFYFFYFYFFYFFVTKFVGRLSYRTPSRTELKFGR
jgi:hypothetical protein